jgi:NitT/TauT family transport system ATP-binding protein
VVSASPKIVASHVSHRFDADSIGASGYTSELILNDLSLSLAEGEFVSLIGPSGCGKTTLLNIIAGFVTPMSGTVAIDGTVIDRVQAGRVAFMFAQDALFPWRTALGNVAFPLECGRGAELLRGRKPNAIANELLQVVGLGSATHKFPHELSHGMRQRVALARTIACDSSILLMDEPFGALDAQTRVLMQAEFSRIWEKYRKTVVMVTHDITEAIILSDRVVAMSHRPGRIKRIYDVDIPRPRAVLDLPAQPRFHELYASLWEDLRPELSSEE